MDIKLLKPQGFHRGPFESCKGDKVQLISQTYCIYVAQYHKFYKTKNLKAFKVPTA